MNDLKSKQKLAQDEYDTITSESIKTLCYTSVVEEVVDANKNIISLTDKANEIRAQLQTKTAELKNIQDQLNAAQKALNDANKQKQENENSKNSIKKCSELSGVNPGTTCYSDYLQMNTEIRIDEKKCSEWTSKTVSEKIFYTVTVSELQSNPSFKNLGPNNDIDIANVATRNGAFGTTDLKELCDLPDGADNATTCEKDLAKWLKSWKEHGKEWITPYQESLQEIFENDDSLNNKIQSCQNWCDNKRQEMGKAIEDCMGTERNNIRGELESLTDEFARICNDTCSGIKDEQKSKN